MAAIAYWCVARHVPALQQQITGNAQAAVISANADDINVTADGRTVILAGVVSSDIQKEQLINVVADAAGVRSVNDQLTVAVPVQDETNVVSAPVQTAQADTIIVEGAVKDLVEADTNTEETLLEEENTATIAAETIEPADQPADVVINEADEKPRVLETSVEAAAELLSNNNTNTAADLAEPNLEVAELALNPDIPADEETESATDADTIDARALALIEQARKETANSLIDPQTPRPNNGIAQQTQSSTTLSEAQRTVAITDLPSLKMHIDEGTLTLTGEISNDDSLLTFIRTAMTTFDANYVVNSVQVNDYTAKADWLSALNSFLPEMRSVSNAGIDIIESQITLSGEAANDTQHDQVIDKALAELSKLSLVERISVSKQEPSGSDNTNSQSDVALTKTTTTTETKTTSAIDPQAQRQALKEAYGSLDADKILFESGSDVLTEESLGVIETIAAVFAEYPSVKIEIDGHTDASGLSANNLLLSQLRANAVRDYLVKQGIAAERMSAYGFGDGVPIADNSTAAGRRLNRRIEFNF